MTDPATSPVASQGPRVDLCMCGELQVLHEDLEGRCFRNNGCERFVSALGDPLSPKPRADLDLKNITRRAHYIRHAGHVYERAAKLLADDALALLAEVDRLRNDAVRLRAENQELRDIANHNGAGVMDLSKRLVHRARVCVDEKNRADQAEAARNTLRSALERVVAAWRKWVGERKLEGSEGTYELLAAMAGADRLLDGGQE